jgi:hypothetical protein
VAVSPSGFNMKTVIAVSVHLISVAEEFMCPICLCEGTLGDFNWHNFKCPMPVGQAIAVLPVVEGCAKASLCYVFRC